MGVALMIPKSMLTMFTAYQSQTQSMQRLTLKTQFAAQATIFLYIVLMILLSAIAKAGALTLHQTMTLSCLPAICAEGKGICGLKAAK